MICLIIETPLTENNVGARVLHACDHVREVILLHLLEALIVGGTLDFQTVLSLGLGWLEWARQDAHLSILGNFRHLWVRELFVNDDTLNEA